MKLGIATPNHVSGDAIQYACIPENFFRTTGEKLIDFSNSFVFDHNPFVLRGEKPDKVINLWTHHFPHSDKDSNRYLSKSERWCGGLGIKMFLRHPRLYIHEDIKKLEKEKRLLTVHCSGKSRGHLSDKIVDHIHQKYENWDIVQVGGSHDRSTPFIDLRGASFWEGARIIASSDTFIGIDSAMYHVSRCYPNVRRKVIIQDNHFNKEQLRNFRPFTEGFDDWIDFDTEYFNEFDYDIGITNALYKI